MYTNNIMYTNITKLFHIFQAFDYFLSLTRAYLSTNKKKVEKRGKKN